MELSVSRRRSVLFVVSTVSFLIPFMSSSVVVALPAISRDLALSAVLQSWVQTAFLLSTAVFMAPFGRIGDIRGRKGPFVWGAVFYTLSSLLLAASRSAAALIFFRVLQGFGCAMLFANSMAILVAVYPAQQRGRVLGIATGMVYLGLSLGPLLGGVITDRLGWRSLFLGNAPIGLVVLIAILTRLENQPGEARGEKFDFPGAALYGLSLTALIYGFSELATLSGAALAGAGLAGIAGFVAWEKRAKAPLMSMDLFARNRIFAFSSLAALIHYAATFGAIFLMSDYLQYVRGMTAERAGIFLMAQPIVMTLFAPTAGALSDRVEPRLVATSGMALTGMSLLAISFLGPATPSGVVLALLIAMGAGLGLFSSPNANAIMGSVERRDYGIASGTLGVMRVVGQSLSMGLVAFLFSLYVGDAELAPAHYAAFLKCFRAAFVLFAVLCGLGTLASFVRGDMLRPKQSRVKNA